MNNSGLRKQDGLITVKQSTRKVGKQVIVKEISQEMKSGTFSQKKFEQSIKEEHRGSNQSDQIKLYIRKKVVTKSDHLASHKGEFYYQLCVCTQVAVTVAE